VDGRKSYSGILGPRTEEYLELTVEEDGQESQLVKLPLELVSKVRLQVIF
jgi:hypothetical protein